MTSSASRAVRVRRDIARFVEFKRTLGYKYVRAQLALESFERFVVADARTHSPMRLDRAMLAWVARAPGRKPLTVSFDICVLRQFCAYLRRASPRGVVREPVWPQMPATSDFFPHIFSMAEVRQLLRRAAELERPPFRGRVFRTLLLVLYCTGLRFGEALRLRLRDLDSRACVLRVSETKGRARIVPFHRSLARELDRYLTARRAFARAAPGDYVFVGADGIRLPTKTASDTIRRLLRDVGLKPRSGRVGPRPYDMRHTFAVHRLTRWYRAGVDLHARLPWLSAYMGHEDILGTETYLTATPELLALAGHRFRGRYLKAGIST